jgi:3-methylcrotonyl-CoA carboxylase alpha subunit/acetyl-CoA/propionyl-CoA carboxylase biotin carboxyl carrier protein
MAIETLLIANRGEIALRVIRTARRMGVRTVAIYAAADSAAPHVRAADDAVPVTSYLDIDAVVAAAVTAGADAIHPGYGFLSERSAFARAVETAGLTLVGPSADVMDRMGKKDAAREIAIKAGVPVVPSFPLGPESPGDSGPSAGMTFPVLVKAAAGGGGKGMRIVRSAGEYDAALAAARREAAKAFGDDTMLIEKYVEHGRHIEVQVLADHHGNVVHLFERDCSTQRRHQKVLEEAPGPTMTAELRERVTSAAVALSREVGYTNAGTVEFLLDSDTGEAYFLEMNTRLQVEHPVTEAICGGLDLVEHQIRVAGGEVLALQQADLAIDGHAIEARVYAEDPFHDFLPQAGTPSLVRWPSAPVRVDAALESGQTVSTAYDPMLGKIIVHGPDRESARRGLVAALDRTAILGLTTNTGFLRTLVASDEFRDATIDTAWLDRNDVPVPDSEIPVVIAAWVDAALVAMGWATSAQPGDPFAADGWRLAGPSAPVLVELEVDGDVRTLRVDRAAGLVDGVEVIEYELADHVAVLAVDGRRHRAVVNAQTHSIEVAFEGHRHVFVRPDVFGDHGPAVGDGTLLAPMPGTVLDVAVTEGQRVAEGETLGAMEAMKMELALKAPFAGTVTTVGAAAGDQVALGATLFVVEPVVVEPEGAE